MEVPREGCGISRMSEELRGSPAERLRVYWLALELARDVDAVSRLARIFGSLAGQLTRAANSVVLNIAEGAAHFSAGKKIYHYQLAYGSAEECIAALRRIQQHRPAVSVEREIRKANMVMMMLVRLIQTQQQRRGE